MELSKELIEKITKLVIEEVTQSTSYETIKAAKEGFEKDGSENELSVEAISKDRLSQNTWTELVSKQIDTMQENSLKDTSGPDSKYINKKIAYKGTNPKEVVIGVGPAYQKEIRRTIHGLCLSEVLKNIKAGIEEEGMVTRVVKILKTSDVCFMGLEAAKLSGSGIGIGLQSKGTTVIHQKDLYPLSNLELFPQAPLMTLETYRAIGKNAAKYVKGEKVKPIEGQNDPMVRAKYQVKAALMHIKETEQVSQTIPWIEWEVR